MTIVYKHIIEQAIIDLKSYGMLAIEKKVLNNGTLEVKEEIVVIRQQ